MNIFVTPIVFTLLLISSYEEYDTTTKILTIHTAEEYNEIDRCDYAEHLIIEDGVTTVTEEAFDDWSYLQTVIIRGPVTIISIGFSNCGELRTVEIESDLITLGIESFSFDRKL
ncbi:hypothetical protein GPJ56_010872 [Histomonas meleagridis]|uniref:uncharacterized protein n=1 Tax=Histomonas meleagridis TaxID=135588 RepID=UPI00355997E1|nr:hypothetical protein GPJ56_010872 [Histomonas meleagridis]KAH0803706.1 hypothetical protein GO595_003480 [Histomonas meleagridis]